MIGSKKVIGFVAEFNPFHDGHKYFINKIRESFPDSYIVCAMSTYFVQRGEPAIFDPYVRGKEAISAGVDLILGLPTCVSLSSAENFAKGSVGLLNSLGYVDYLAFGTFDITLDELKSYNEKRSDGQTLLKVKEEIKKGKTYALALEEILGVALKEDNVLAAEYLRALDVLSSTMQPFPIEKDDTKDKATKLREEIYKECCDENLIPIKEYKGYGIPITSACFSDYITSACIDAYFKLKPDGGERDILKDFDDINPKLLNKIFTICTFQMPFDEMVSRLKTKNWTASYIKRALFKIALRIIKAIPTTLQFEHYAEYYFLVAYSTEGKALMKYFVGPVSINFVLSNLKDTTNDIFSTIVYTSDCYAHSTYASIYFGKNHKKDI
jgi:predicted nucleotidyltransferase